MSFYWYTPSRCILTLVTLSSLFVFLGCLVCGFLLLFAPEEPSPDLNGGYYSSIPTIFLMVAAACTLFALILGCCGTFKDSKIILLVFAVLTLFIAAIQLGSTGAVFVFTMNGKIEEEVTSVMIRDLIDYSQNSTKNIFNTIQNGDDCCGVHNYTDWWTENTTWKREENCSNYCLPKSCCSDDTIKECIPGTTVKPQGCLDLVMDRLKLVIYPVFGFSVAVALLQVLTALLACYGAFLIRRYQSYVVL